MPGVQSLSLLGTLCRPVLEQLSSLLKLSWITRKLRVAAQALEFEVQTLSTVTLQLREGDPLLDELLKPLKQELDLCLLTFKQYSLSKPWLVLKKNPKMASLTQRLQTHQLRLEQLKQSFSVYFVGDLYALPAHEAARKLHSSPQHETRVTPNCLRPCFAPQLFGRDVEFHVKTLIQNRMLQLLAGPGEGKSELAAAVGHHMWVAGHCLAGAYWIDMTGVGEHATAAQDWICQQLTCQTKLPDVKDWAGLLKWLKCKTSATLLVLDNVEEAVGSHLAAEDLAFVLNSLHRCESVFTIVCSQAPLPCVTDLPASALQELTPLPTAAALQLLLHCISDTTSTPHQQHSFLSGSEWELPVGPVLAQNDSRLWYRSRSSPVNSSPGYVDNFSHFNSSMTRDCHRGDYDQGPDRASPSSSPGGNAHNAKKFNDADAVRDQTPQELHAGSKVLEGDNSPYVAHSWRARDWHSDSLSSVVAGAVAESQSVGTAASHTCNPALRRSHTSGAYSQPLLVQDHAAVVQRGVAVQRERCAQQEDTLGKTLVPGKPADGSGDGMKPWWGWNGTHRRGVRDDKVQWRSREEEDNAKRLVQRVHANPLMLTVAGGLLRRGVIRWQDLLSDTVLDSTSVDDITLSNHTTLLYCWLRRSLSDHELAFLSYLSVFPGSFTAYGAMHVQPLHPAPLSVPSPSHTLHYLLSLSLLHTFPSTSGDRFTLSNLIRLTARECVNDAVWLDTERRFMEWMVREETGPGWLLTNHHPARGPQPDPAICLQVLEAEGVNLQEVCKTLPVLADAVTQRWAVADGGGSSSRDGGSGGRSERDQDDGEQQQQQRLHQILGQVHQLCTCLRELGLYHLEIRLEQAIWDTAAAKFGPRHPDTLGAKNQLASTYCCRGQLIRAKQLHQEVLTARSSILGERHRDTAHTKAKLGKVLHRIGELEDAQKLQNEALATLQEVLGKGHHETLDVLGELAKTLLHLGDLKAARSLFQQELDARMSAHGIRHPHTLRSMHRFASALQKMGEMQLARGLMEEVVRVREELLGHVHPDVLRNKTQLAQILCSPILGELQRARQLFEDAGTGLEWVLGARHPDALHARANLASTTWELGEWQRAFEIQERLVQQYKAVHGPHELLSLVSQHKLADMHLQLGEYSRAVQMLEQLCEICVTELGESSLEAMRVRLSLGEGYRRVGDLKKAWQMMQHLLESCMLVHGLHHEETWRVKRTLGVVTAQLGELEKGRELLEDALNFQVRQLGHTHPDSIRTRHSLAKTLRHLGNVRHARRLQEDVLKAFVMVLGPNHPDTLSAQHSLAQSLQQLGEIHEAHQLLQDLWEAHMDVLGPNHPALLTLKHSFATSFRQQGQLHMARELLEQLMQEQAQALGPLHLSTLNTKHSMAVLLQDMGELQSARLLESQVLQQRESLLGERHPDTLVSRCVVGFLDVQLGRLQSAQEGLRETWEACALVLGPWHPNTLAAKHAVGEALCLLGDLQQAQRLQQEVLEARAAELGSRHPDTLLSKQALAVTMHDLGHLEMGRQLQEEVVAGRMLVLGHQHLDTLQAKLDLADMLEDGGDLPAAKAVRDEVQGLMSESMGGRQTPDAEQFRWGCGGPCRFPTTSDATLVPVQSYKSSKSMTNAASRSTSFGKGLKKHVWGCWAPMADTCVYRPGAGSTEVVLTHSVQGTTGRKLHGRGGQVSAESRLAAQYVSSTVVPRTVVSCSSTAKREFLQERVSSSRCRTALSSNGGTREYGEDSRDVLSQQDRLQTSERAAAAFWAEGSGRWSPEEAGGYVDPETERRRELEAAEAWEAL